MHDLAGRVAVVTGGASGIGLGMARAFVAEGMQVVLADAVADRLNDAVASLTDSGGSVIGIPADVSRIEDVKALADATMDSFGAVHVLCNNAGIGSITSISSLTIEEWEWVLAVDLWGPIYGVTTFLPLIERQGEGHINTTSSMAGLVSSGLMAPYNVAKHGVIALMETLERELRAARSPVRASVLCPGPINTDILGHSDRSREQRLGERLEVTAHAVRHRDALAAQLSHGTPPEAVGRLVVEAMRSERFWIFTHPELVEMYRVQVDAMLADGSLTRLSPR